MLAAVLRLAGSGVDKPGPIRLWLPSSPCAVVLGGHLRDPPHGGGLRLESCFHSHGDLAGSAGASGSVASASGSSAKVKEKADDETGETSSKVILTAVQRDRGARSEACSR